MGGNANNAKLYEVMAARDSELPAATAIRRTLQVIRSHLGMDVACLARFEGATWVLHDFEAAHADTGLILGQTLPHGETFCGNVADGHLPRVIPDVSAIPLAANLAVAIALNIGAYVGAEVVLEDGDVWGMLCCYSFRADPSLNERDLALVEAFTEIVAFEVARERAAGRQAKESLDRVSSVLEEADGMIALLQPIWELSRGVPWGAEALCRIMADPSRGPDDWFAEADAVSLRGALELAALRKAAVSIVHLDPTYVLSINVSPSTVMTAEFREAIAELPPHRLLIELTEHLPVDDYGALRAALAPLRGSGLRLAVDDAGGGYASMTHILQLRPDIIKADMSLTRDIDSDKAKQALVAALVSFAEATRATLLAEGVETAAELAELKRLGVTLGQGYLLGRPAHPETIESAFSYGAAAFRPALIRGREAAEAHVTDLSQILDARRRFAGAVDPRLARWVV